MRLFFLLAVPLLLAEERTVEPTFLRRTLKSAPKSAAQGCGDGCTYRALFGAGDAEARIAKGVARYGTLSVTGSARLGHATEEQILFVLAGAADLVEGVQTTSLRQGDFAYISPGLQPELRKTGATSFEAVWMCFRVPKAQLPDPEPRITRANLDECKKQVVGNHPPSTLYQLMIGDRKSTRDRIAAGLVVTSLFIMEFSPGGTNFPHHHDREEEIYLLLDGKGEMVAGPGSDGVEGKFPAQPGDAYFYRLNTTVGFYNQAPKSRILAIRSLYPFSR